MSAAPKTATAATSIPLAIGLVVVVLFFVGSGIVAYRNTTFLTGDARAVAHTHEVITSLDDLASLIKDAETGQRGFVITGDERYLEPYESARTEIEGAIEQVESLTRDNTEQQSALSNVRQRIAAKLAELEESIEARRARGFEAARDIVISDRGKRDMEAIRESVARMEAIESRIRAQRVSEMQEAHRTAVLSGIASTVLGIVLSLIVALLLHRTLALRRRTDWLQAGRIGLGTAISGEQRPEELGKSILEFLATYLHAHAGVVFTREGAHFQRVASYGVPGGSTVPGHFRIGEGLLGEAAARDSTILVPDVPDGYLTFGSGLGQGNPRHLVISAASTNGAVHAVVELGFLKPVSDLSMELLRQTSEPIAIAIRSALYRSELQELLEETQRQAEELQAQSEELRVNNEELEEQSRALKESQTRLEQQQAELEQTNAQLEEQTKLLEVQRNDLVRAKVAVQAKADELERASRYKSDFLANMSHELRTPLNSSLILSKLLADNPGGNLTGEQVKYAETIQAAGNDLLALINDILDLSKIEAGHMEVHSEPVPVSRIVSDLARVFEPQAGQKGIAFTTEIEPGCPNMIDIDRKRLEQILRNLLSNAIKFTEQGRVTLEVRRQSDSRVMFTVADTGIGIAEEHQHEIFDAFRQADGTISRRYGGTGLGLSISRELARLLGGAIELRSTPGKGSAFTLLVPEHYDPKLIAEAAEPAPAPARAEPSPPISTPRRSRITDDREDLTSSGRTLLVVEDDESFASILYDLAHEAGFQCLMATTAEDGLMLARQHLPNALLLDVGLPDNSGLSVLDRLKQDKRTRHIPVHVISVDDHAQTARSLGAAGYMLKPAKRDELVEALRDIEGRIADGRRRVLIVEDDTVQRESLSALLGSNDVETIAVGTAADCLARLKEATFDCMVLDLSLPDASGYSLLETLSREDSYSFPPVIVYTGRDLSHGEEQQLRRYSRSIIIKGAKSPERLLDEVTLFLHRVVAELPPEQQKMIEKAQNRDAILEGRRVLVVEDDIRNVYALTNILEPRGAIVRIARNGREALELLEKDTPGGPEAIDLVLMDVMMPEMDGLTATREIRRRKEWRKLPIIMLTAKAMRSDQDRCLDAGANDYMAKPLDVEKLLSLVRVWMPR